MHFIILPALLSLVGPHAAEHVVFVLYCFGVGGSGGATSAVLIAVVVEGGCLAGMAPWVDMCKTHAWLKALRCHFYIFCAASAPRPLRILRLKEQQGTSHVSCAFSTGATAS